MTDTLLYTVIAGLLIILAVVVWYLFKLKKANQAESKLSENSATDGTSDSDDEAHNDSHAQHSAWVHGVKLKDEPPVYQTIKEERERQAKARREGVGVPVFGEEGLKFAPIDNVVQWTLKVEGDDKHPISVGQISLLSESIKRYLTGIPYEAWAKSKKDGLYYPLNILSTDAHEVIVGVTYANRRFLLTEEIASQVRNVVETLASEELTPTDLSQELGRVEEVAKVIQRYVFHCQHFYRVYLVPRNPDEPISEHQVCLEAPKANFKPMARGFGYWINPFVDDPAFVLMPVEGREGWWELIFDAQLANIKRGEFKRFFAVMNHIASLLGARCVTSSGRPLSLPEILQEESKLLAKQEEMGVLCIQPGSPRAYKLWAGSF